MKKLLVTMIAILASGASYALPVGNPSEASLLCDGLFWEGSCCADPCDPCINWCDAFSLRVGFYGDYVFNRHLAQPIGADDDDNEPDFDIEHTQLFTNAGYIALNFWDRIDLFTSLGNTNLFISTNTLHFGGDSGGRLEIEADTRFSWSVGGRATLWECGCTALGFEGQYFRTKTRIKRITNFSNEGTTSLYPDEPGSGDRPIYSEWQVGLGLSHRINILVPYVAVKYARAFWDFEDNFYLVGDDVIIPGNIEADKNWGWAVGVSLVDCEKAALTVEGRFADEKAVYVNGQIRF